MPVFYVLTNSKNGKLYQQAHMGTYIAYVPMATLGGIESFHGIAMFPSLDAARAFVKDSHPFVISEPSEVVFDMVSVDYTVKLAQRVQNIVNTLSAFLPEEPDMTKQVDVYAQPEQIQTTLFDPNMCRRIPDHILGREPVVEPVPEKSIEEQFHSVGLFVYGEKQVYRDGSRLICSYCNGITEKAAADCDQQSCGFTSPKPVFNYDGPVTHCQNSHCGNPFEIIR